jgi:hypothetical protein
MRSTQYEQPAFDFVGELPVTEHEPFDVTAARHQGAETSKAANLKVDKAFQRKTIRRILATNKAACAHEIKELTGWALNCFSGRLTEMRVDGFIEIVAHCEKHGMKARIYRLTDLGKQLAEQEQKV